MNYKQKAVITLKKANSLTKKVLKMTEEDKYCIDIIQQNLAVIGLLKSANSTLLEGHLGCCVTTAAKEGDEKKIDIMMGEILKVVKTAQNK